MDRGVVLARKRRCLGSRGYEGLRWRLEIAIHYLGALPLSAIDEGTIEDRLVPPLLEDRAAIAQARSEGASLTEKVTDARRTYEILAGLNVV